MSIQIAASYVHFDIAGSAQLTSLQKKPCELNIRIVSDLTPIFGSTPSSPLCSPPIPVRSASPSWPPGFMRISIVLFTKNYEVDTARSFVEALPPRNDHYFDQGSIDSR